MTRRLAVGRLLAEPGRSPALRNAELTIAGGRIVEIAGSDGAPRNGRIALPAMVNAHDHGYGVRPLALGGYDDGLECWIASFVRLPIDPRLEAAIAFGRMALAGIGSTVHCHNSLAADRLAAEAAGVARAAADVGIRVAFTCPIRDRNPWVYGEQQNLLPYLTGDDAAAVDAALRAPAPAHRQEEIAEAHESESSRSRRSPRPTRANSSRCNTGRSARNGVGTAPSKISLKRLPLTTGGCTCIFWNRRASASGSTPPTNRASCVFWTISVCCRRG